MAFRVAPRWRHLDDEAMDPAVAVEKEVRGMDHDVVDDLAAGLRRQAVIAGDAGEGGGHRRPCHLGVAER